MDANVYRSAARPTGRRFSMSVPRLRVPRLLLLSYLPLIAAGLVVEIWVPSKYVTPFLFASVFALIGIYLYSQTRKRVPVEVGLHGVSIDGGRGGTFPVEGATLGMWLVELYRCPAGLALHLDGRDGRRCCIGGRNLRPWPGAPLAAQPIEAVYGYLPREDFADLLQEVAASLKPVPEDSALRFPLVANGAPHCLRNLPAPQNATLIVEIDASQLTLFDATTGARVASAPRSAVQLERAAHTYPGKDRGFTMAALILRAPGIEPLFIGVPDSRFKWRGVAPADGKPVYQLGSPDWLALAERLGAADALEVSLD